MELTTGTCLMHNSRAVELLYKVASDKNCEVWRIKTLFTDPVEDFELFRYGEPVTRIHTQRPV